MRHFISLPALMVFILLALSPQAAHAYGSEARWMDKALPEALRQQLVTPGTWKKVARDLAGLSPALSQPLVMKYTCIAKLDSAFTREMEVRGAKIIATKECAKILVFAGEGDHGRTYTFEELQKKFAPVESEAEAASFLVATGFTTNNSWYGAAIEGAFYIMTVESTCKGLGNKRSIFEIASGGTNKIVATINEPPPVGAACPGGY